MWCALFMTRTVQPRAETQEIPVACLVLISARSGSNGEKKRLIVQLLKPKVGLIKAKARFLL